MKTTAQKAYLIARIMAKPEKEPKYTNNLADVNLVLGEVRGIVNKCAPTFLLIKS